MMRPYRHIFILTLLLTVLVINLQKGHADGINETKFKWRADRDTLSLKLTITDKVMDLLAIKPGMTILDIGTGTGQFAYEFAQRLKGTGKVFATDIDANCINYVKEETDKKGLSNLYPVLVAKDGLDEFYGKHKYDLITLFHVTISHNPKIDYFRKLRGSLADNGRLIIIFNKIPSLFSPEDFTGNFRGLIKELSLELTDSPFYKILSGTTRKAIKQHSGSGPEEDLKKAIARDFNHVLSDSSFGLDFISGAALKNGLAFSQEEKDFADWLLLSMRYKNILNRKILSPEQLQYVTPFNKLLIIQRFRQYFDKDRMFMSERVPRVRENLEKAGYKLEKVYSDILFFEDILVFRSGQDGKK